MRRLSFLLLIVFLSSCGYSAKSMISIDSRSSTGAAELSAVIKGLRGHNDGCFSERNAKMLVTHENSGKVYHLTNNISALDLTLTLNKSGDGLYLELNEWMEKSFSAHADRCYQSLIKRLRKTYAREQLDIKEACEAISCRP